MTAFIRALWRAIPVLAALAAPLTASSQTCLSTEWREEFEHPNAPATLLDLKTASDRGVFALINIAEPAGGRAVLLKIGSGGGVQWTVFIGHQTTQYATGVLLAADSSGGAFVVTIDSTTASPRWSLHRFSPAGAELWQMVLDMDNPVAMDGDALNRVGIWGTRQGDKYGLVIDGNGNTIMGASVTVEPEPWTTHTAALPTGEIAVATTLRLYAGHSDLQCNIYTLDGGQEWDVMVEGTGSNEVAYARDVCMDPAGEVYILSRCGTTASSRGEIVRLARANGAQQWACSLVVGGDPVTPERITFGGGRLVTLARVGTQMLAVRFIDCDGTSPVEHAFQSQADDGTTPVLLQGLGNYAVVSQTTRAAGHPETSSHLLDETGLLCSAARHDHACIARAACGASSELTVVGSDVSRGSVEIVAMRVVAASAPLAGNSSDAVESLTGRTVSMLLPRRDNLRVHVVDMQGRVVELPVAQLPEGDATRVRMSGSNIAAGVYLVTLTQGDDVVRRWRWLCW